MSSRRLDSSSVSPRVQRVASAFRLSGWASFWSQAVLAIISAIVLLFAAVSFSTPRTQPIQTIPGQIPQQVPATNPGTGAGSFFAVLGLILLLVGIAWAFRYVLLSRRLKAPDSQNRPNPGAVIQALQIGILISLSGIGITLLGNFATVGSLVGKSVTQRFNLAFGTLQLIDPIDLLVVQANINIILAHFIALVVSLVLLRTVNNSK